MSYELQECTYHIDLEDPDSYVGRPTLKVALLTLARHANDEGDVQGISRSQLMRESGIRGRSYWGSTMNVLERLGWLDRIAGRGAGNHSVYLLDAEKMRHTADLYVQLRRVS